MKHPTLECPTCKGALYVEATEWDAETGVPTEEGLEITCENWLHDDPDKECLVWTSYDEGLALLDAVYPWAKEALRYARD